MDKLNKLELAILERLSNKYPLIKNHIPFLKVESRENTGVGMYINITYCIEAGKTLDLEIEDGSLGSDESVQMNGLKHGLAYEVDVKKGRLNFIELVSYGEEWDGKVRDDFIFIK
ncbi:hypothetical protein [Gracilimonas tropica]|uniref:hypothetical protein n=1 Tax=Gracilimonas tropica TaxID=454600 RepID=UPI00036EE72F|nr:hypothetical protein [Gracilimonas tropica]